MMIIGIVERNGNNNTKCNHRKNHLLDFVISRWNDESWIMISISFSTSTREVVKSRTNKKLEK